MNETLESLQRPYNHLRRLGSEGRPDQLRRFVGYIQQRTPAFEKAVEKLLKETGQSRDHFLANFRTANAEVLATNEKIYAISDAIAPESKKQAKSRKNKRARSASKLRGTVDPKTQLADGTKIADLHALKTYILEHKRDQFTETLIRKMLAYSLGRYLDFTDTEAVKSIHVEFAKDEFRVQSLIRNIVLSEPFLSK